MSRSIFKTVYLGNDTSGVDISDRISYLRFAESIKKDDGLELFAEGADADYLLELDEMETGKPLIFNFGYIGAEVSPTFRAIITDYLPKYTAEGTFLTITCGDRGRAMRKARAKKVWKQKSTDQIFKELGHKHGMGVYIEVPIGGFMTHVSLPQANQSSMEFLQSLAAKEKDGNYICFVTGNDLHLVTRNVGDTSKDNIVVGQYDNLIEFDIARKETTAPDGANEVGTPYGKINPKTALDNIVTGETAIYATSSALYLKDKSGNRTLLIDAEGRRTAAATSIFRPEQLDQISTNANTAHKNYSSKNPQQKLSVGEGLRVPLSKEQASIVEDDRDTGGSIVSGTTNGFEYLPPLAQSEEETANVASSIHKEAVHKILTATLKEYGNPLRKVHTIITVSGIATRFVGNWMIDTVQHDVGKDTYITTSSCSKTGTKRGGVKTTGGGNTSEGKAGTDDTLYIGTQGADNGRVYSKDKTTGAKTTVEYTPYNPNKDPGLGKPK